MRRVKLFIDFWNFQLDWNHLVGKNAAGQPVRIPWSDTLPKVLVQAVGNKLGEKASYAGAHVYASVDPGKDSGLRKFLHAMDSFAGYAVVVKERKARKGGVRCTECHKEIEKCSYCSKPLRRTVEKGIDAAIITQMIQMASDNIYDAAVLCSADADLCQAVEFIQQRFGKQIYSLWFPGVGVDLRNACWDHFSIAPLLGELGVGGTSPADSS